MSLLSVECIELPSGYLEYPRLSNKEMHLHYGSIFQSAMLGFKDQHIEVFGMFTLRLIRRYAFWLHMLMPKPQLHYLAKKDSDLYGVVGRGVSFMSKEKSNSSKRCFHMFSLNGIQKKVEISNKINKFLWKDGRFIAPIPLQTTFAVCCKNSICAWQVGTNNHTSWTPEELNVPNTVSTDN